MFHLYFYHTWTGTAKVSFPDSTEKRINEDGTQPEKLAQTDAEEKSECATSIASGQEALSQKSNKKNAPKTPSYRQIKITEHPDAKIEYGYISEDSEIDITDADAGDGFESGEIYKPEKNIDKEGEDHIARKLLISKPLKNIEENLNPAEVKTCNTNEEFEYADNNVEIIVINNPHHNSAHAHSKASDFVVSNKLVISCKDEPNNLDDAPSGKLTTEIEKKWTNSIAKSTDYSSFIPARAFHQNFSEIPCHLPTDLLLMKLKPRPMQML